MIQLIAYVLGFRGIIAFAICVVLFAFIAVFKQNSDYEKWYSEYYK